MIIAILAFIAGIYVGWTYIKKPDWFDQIQTQIVSVLASITALIKRTFTSK